MDTDRVAIAILEDAANSFLTRNGFTPDNDCIDAAVCLLTEWLIAVLGAPPDYARLVDRIIIFDPFGDAQALRGRAFP